MPPFIPSMSFSSTCTCSRMTSLAEIEAGAYIRHDCLAYVLQEADNVGGTSLFFFCCSKMLIAVSQVSYIILLLHKIASFSQIYEKLGVPHGSGVLLLAVCELRSKVGGSENCVDHRGVESSMPSPSCRAVCSCRWASAAVWWSSRAPTRSR